MFSLIQNSDYDQEKRKSPYNNEKRKSPNNHEKPKRTCNDERGTTCVPLSGLAEPGCCTSQYGRRRGQISSAVPAVGRCYQIPAPATRKKVGLVLNTRSVIRQTDPGVQRGTVLKRPPVDGAT